MRCPTLASLPPPPSSKTGWPWTIQTPPLPGKRSDGSAWPRISIVTPSYNQGEYIEETIRSVLLQGYPNLEYIVMDGASTDGSIRIIEKYASWIASWESTKDCGQAHAINKGFHRATGSIYGWLNSDDFYFLGGLAAIAKAWSPREKQFFYGDCLSRDCRTQLVRYCVAPPMHRAFLGVGGCLYQHSSLWSAEIHEDLMEELDCAIDAELWYRLIPKAEPLTYINYPVAGVNRHELQKTTNPAFAEKWRLDNAKMSKRHNLWHPSNRLINYWNWKILPIVFIFTCRLSNIWRRNARNIRACRIVDGFVGD